MSHPIRESLAFFESFVPNLVRFLFAIHHCLKEYPKPSLILCTPVIKAFRSIFRLFEKKRPGSMGKFNWGGIRKLPVYHPNDFSSFIDHNILWSEVVALNWEWAMLMRYPFVPSSRSRTSFRRQSSAESIALFLWCLRCEICSSARASKYKDALSYIAVGSFDRGSVPKRTISFIEMDNGRYATSHADLPVCFRDPIRFADSVDREKTTLASSL